MQNPRKGGRLHPVAGTVFLVAILVMSGIGALVAPFLPDRPSTIAGILTFYLAATGWMTMKRKPGATGAFEIGGLIVALSIAAAALVFIRMAANNPAHTLDGEPSQALYIFLLLGTIAAASDLKLIVRGGISGVPRIARHLWRMCVALLIAAASFFLGQQKLMPAFVRGSPFLFIPAFAPLVLMIYWLFRIRLTKMFRDFGSGRPVGMNKRLEAA